MGPKEIETWRGILMELGARALANPDKQTENHSRQRDRAGPHQSFVEHMENILEMGYPVNWPCAKTGNTLLGSQYPGQYQRDNQDKTNDVDREFLRSKEY